VDIKRYCRGRPSSTLVPAGAAQASLSHRLTTRRASLGRALRASATYPTFTGRGPVVALANRSLRAAAEQGLREFRAQGRRDLGKQPSHPGPWDYEAKPYITLAEPRLISVHFALSEYTGGAHGMLNFDAYTFGLVSGRSRLLKLRDLFRSGERDVKALSPLLIAKLKAGDRASLVKSGDVKSIDAGSTQWSLSRKAITFLFPPYELGSYAEGPHEVKLLFSELRNRLNPQGPLKGLL
jgi:hypothetical protein